MKSIHKAYIGILLAVVFLTVVVWWFNRGYGEVSLRTYQYSQALYSACLNKNEMHLGKVEAMLANGAETLPAKERAWIDSIVSEARDGNWEYAANKARRMMEDQVQY